MKYIIVKIRRNVPVIEGMTIVCSLSEYMFIRLTPEAESVFPFNNYRWEEITEEQATVGIKFYGVSKEYRKAYSAVEGLEPDSDENGKTKVYFTNSIMSMTTDLMKKVLKNRVRDEFDIRGTRDGETTILNGIDACQNVKEVNQKVEDLFGESIPIPQAQELGLLDEYNNRIIPVTFGVKF